MPPSIPRPGNSDNSRPPPPQYNGDGQRTGVKFSVELQQRLTTNESVFDSESQLCPSVMERRDVGRITAGACMENIGTETCRYGNSKNGMKNICEEFSTEELKVRCYMLLMVLTNSGN